MNLFKLLRPVLLIAALYLLTAVVLGALRQRHVLDAETVARLMGVVMGLVLLASANAIPKKLVPLAQLSCAPSRDQTLRRFAARVLVLGSLGYTLAYAFAPMAIAATLATCLLVPAALLVAGIQLRCTWRHGATRRNM